MLVGIISAIIWELRAKEPVVDLRMLKDRNFAIATTGYVLSGICFVLQYGTDSTAFTANVGVHRGDGWEGAVAGRSSDHVHDASGGIC